MENPRPEKVAVVEEVRGRLATANASVVTEYRGLTVAQLAELRKSLAAVGDYKIYKNTLVRLAIAGSEYEELADVLSGPTAIAFVNGEISAAAKTLRDFARANPALVLKGALIAGSTLSTQDLTRLADLPSRDVLLARFAGALAAPLQQLAGLLQALPRNLAYGLSALIEARGGAPASTEVSATPDAEPEVSATPDAEPAVDAGAESPQASVANGSDEAPSSDGEADAEAGETQAEASDVGEAEVEVPGGDESAPAPDGEG